MIDFLNTALRRVPTWTIYLAGVAGAAWLFWLGLTGGLGPEPINALEREYGEVALQLIIGGLAITPLRSFLGLNLIRFRRAIGVTAFFFVLAHFLVWVVLDVQSLDRMWTEIIKRPYVTVGFTAFVLMLPLAVTSNNWSLRKLGALAWRRLHKLTYAVGVLGVLHYIWLVKGFPYEPLVYAGVLAALFAARLKGRWPLTRRTA